MRRDTRYGKNEDRPPPADRTHSNFVRQALDNKNHRGKKCHAPYKRTGVKGLSPLAALPLFDMIWDITPDMMHIVEGIWKRHIFAMFKGERRPARPKNFKSYTVKENAVVQEEHAVALKQLEAWTLDNDKQKLLDQRSMQLGGESTWIRSNIKVCSKASTLKAHDWFLLIQSAGFYLLRDIFPPASDALASLYMILEATSLCLRATSACDSQNREVIDHIKQQVIEGLCALEANLPRDEPYPPACARRHVPVEQRAELLVLLW